MKPVFPSVRSLLSGMRHAFAAPEVRGLMTLTFAQIGLATAVYRWAEEWSWLDAFYFSVITIATVGYGDFAPQSAFGKLFTVFYILCGLGLFVTATATLASRMLVSARAEESRRSRIPPP